MAAGIINTRAIQLQLELNQPAFNVRFKISTKAIDINPHGKIRKADGLLDGVGIKTGFLKVKVNKFSKKGNFYLIHAANACDETICYLIYNGI